MIIILPSMRKTQTLKKKREGKKDICGCQNKGVDKDHIAFLRKAELLMMSPCRTHTHRLKNTTS